MIEFFAPIKFTRWVRALVDQIKAGL